MTENTNRRRAEPSDRVADIEAQLATLQEKLDEIYEIVAAAKGFFKVLGVIGKAVKWMLVVGGAIGAAWAAFTHKVP